MTNKELEEWEEECKEVEQDIKWILPLTLMIIIIAIIGMVKIVLIIAAMIGFTLGLYLMDKFYEWLNKNK